MYGKRKLTYYNKSTHIHIEERGGSKMTSNQYMMCVEDVAKELECSKSYAYKIVKTLNKELAEQGYITMAGRVPRAYWEKKMYGYEQQEQ